jgi:hypothetical protein
LPEKDGMKELVIPFPRKLRPRGGEALYIKRKYEQDSNR